jgi:hypothetical protein
MGNRGGLNDVIGPGVDLGERSRERLNSVLDGCFLNGCFVDRRTRVGVVALELTSVALEGQRLGDAYPILLVCYPVSRVAAAFRVDGVIRELELDDLNAALNEFNFKEIDDWDIIDPPAAHRLRWIDDLSLDVYLGDGQGKHMLEFWQDEYPFQAINIAIWFDRLFILDANLSSLTLDDLVEAAKRSVALRRAQERDLGWFRTAIVPSFTYQDILGRIGG